jgi:GNAT superfamily N-acetyltransferase
MSAHPPCKLRRADPGVDGEVAAALMVEYLTWGNERLRDEYGVVEPPADPSLEREHLGGYEPPTGVLLIAECDGDPAGVGALRMLSASVAEVKRMYVVPRWRDRHVGSALLDSLLDEARARRANLVRLDTCRFMTDAQRLYRSRGFVERPPYEGTEIPERLRQHWIFFERRLDNVVPGGPFSA